MALKILGVRILPFILGLLSMAPLRSDEGQVPGDGTGEESPAGSGAKKKEAPPHPEPIRPPKLPPSENLKVQVDLSPKVQKELQEAIASLDSAREAIAGRRKLLQKSIDKLRLVAQRAAKSPLPLYHLGIAYQEVQNFPEAKRALEKAVKMNPRFTEAYIGLGDVHVSQKDRPGSLALYEKALEVQPGHPAALFQKVIALIELGRLKEAKPYLQELMEKDSTAGGLKFLSLSLDAELQGPVWPKTYSKETENYEVFTPVSQAFAEEVAGRLELIRRVYNKVFPIAKKPARKYPVWVHEGREAYIKAGGPRMAGGHYDPLFRKLVLFKYPKMDDAVITIYHEAFHQYLQDYLESAPQWFNEGLGDYFGAWEFFREGSEKKMRCRPNRGRLRDAQFAIDQNLCPPAADLMQMSRAEMYAPQMAALHYAQAWGMIYYMLEGPNGGYQKLLVSYFQQLQKGKDQTEAYHATFGKINMDQFDEDWKKYIRGLSGK